MEDGESYGRNTNERINGSLKFGTPITYLQLRISGKWPPKFGPGVLLLALFEVG